MSNPSSEGLDASEIMLQEIAAFLLFAFSEPLEEHALTDCMAMWRSEKDEAREKFRARSSDIVFQLRASGLNVSVRSEKAVKAFIDQLITIPPKQAYELPKS